MSTIVTRAGKGTALTWTEMDANFTNLNNDKYQSGSNPTFGTVTATTYAQLPVFDGVADGIVDATGAGGTTNFLRADGTWAPASGGDASSVTFTPSGTIAATNVQDAIEELDAETSAALSAISGNLPSGTVGIGTFLVSGGVIAWQSNLIYRAGAANYFIDGTAYTSAEQNVTLTASDPTLDRIDVLVLDSAGTLSAIAGTPAASPSETVVDPAVYLRLGIVYVQAASTQPSITNTDIYLDNAEWTATASAGTIVTNSTNNPRSGTYDIEGTNVAANTYVSMVKPLSGTTDLATQNSLVFYVRLKAAFPSTKAFRLGWYSGTALRGSQVTVSNNLFGFNIATVGSYQQIVVPISAFNMPVGNLVTTLRMTVIGSGANVGFYLDDIVLVSGATVLPSLTASRALVSNVSGNVAASAVTATELGYVAGVTSAIQTQLNGKVSDTGDTMTGPLIFSGAIDSLKTALDTDVLVLQGGTGFANGAAGRFYGKTNGINPGWWRLRADDGVTDYTLEGSPAGALFWGSNQLKVSAAASKLIGRGSAGGTGDLEEITLGTGLTMTGTTLSASGGGGGGFTYAATPPGTPNEGDRWVSSTEGILYTYTDDGSTSQWVDYSGTGGSTSPFGSTTEIQYNNAGTFGSTSSFTYTDNASYSAILNVGSTYGTAWSGVIAPVSGIELGDRSALVQYSGSQYFYWNTKINSSYAEVARTASGTPAALSMGGGAITMKAAASNPGAGSAITFTDLLIARGNSDMDVSLPCGRLKFPATQVASSDANTLDDYEEGTWTPTVTPQGGSLTSYTTQTCAYTKIGRMVAYTINFTITNAGTGSGGLIVTLPFTSAIANVGCGREAGVNGPQLQFEIGTSNTGILRKYDNLTAIVTNGIYSVSGTYFV